jgi:hypothetical protein
VLRLPDPRAGGLPAADLGDHHRVVGAAVHEVARAVDRVDGEGVVGGPVAVEHPGVVGGGLLAEHHRVGVRRPQLAGEQQLGLAVGDRDQVTGSLLADFTGAERAEPRHDDLLGHALDQVQHRVGVHARSRSHGPQPTERVADRCPPGSRGPTLSRHGGRGVGSPHGRARDRPW